MIDLHSHILFQIDDGADSIEESLSLIREAVDYGVTDIVLTPHFILGSYDTNNEEKWKLFSLLKKEVEKENIPIRLYLGNEVFAENRLLEFLEKGYITTLHQTKYMLFEVPRFDVYQGLSQVVFELQSHDIVPILAHPERYKMIWDNPNVATTLKEQGVLFQVNLGSFVGIYGDKVKECAILLLKHSMVDFISSDIHHIKHSHYKRLNEVKLILKKYISEEEITKLLVTNPGKVLKNEEIEEKTFLPFQKNIFGKWK